MLCKNIVQAVQLRKIISWTFSYSYSYIWKTDQDVTFVIIYI